MTHYKTPDRLLEAHRLYREQNRDALREKARAYYQANRIEILAREKLRRDSGGEVFHRRVAESSKRWKARNRQAIIEFLGGCCTRCGFRDWRALQIDHVSGGGHRELRSVASLNSYYAGIRASAADGQDKYQLLCANCNQVKRYERDEFKRHYREGKGWLA